MAPPGVNGLQRDFLLARGPLPSQTPLELREDHGSFAKLALSCKMSEGTLVIMNKAKVLA
jgi:hypothetical protein